MTEEKFKKIVVASTVAAVTLLFILIFVLVYQLISISVIKNKKAALQTQITTLEQRIDGGEDLLEIYNSQFYLEKAAREYGYRYAD